MPIGIQELLALGIVAVIVAIAVYRRLRRSKSRQPACGQQPGTTPDESPIHFYRRSDD